MPICTEQRRADIGQFHSLTLPVKVINLLSRGFSKVQNISLFFFNLFYCLFLRQQGDIEVNSDQRKELQSSTFHAAIGM